jgi:hypothetical protein
MNRMSPFLKYRKLAGGIPFLILFGVANRTLAQDGMLVGIRNRFEQFSQQHPQEKLFVHTDKAFYLAGEMIWFSIFDVDGEFNRLLDVSRVAYVEILSADQRPILQAKVSLLQGRGDGSFYLPPTVSSGNYILRAYTSWMKNFSADYYFHQTLSIVNSFHKLVRRVAADSGSAFDVQFFPEGGNLVEGIRSKIGFRVVDRYGKGVDFTGLITDERNDSVAVIQPLKFGLGHFYLTPETGKQYRAQIRIGPNQVLVSSLPQAYNQGWVMQIQDSVPAESLRLAVNCSPALSGQPVYVFVQARQHFVLSLESVPQNGKTEFIIDRNHLPDGISQITVFNGSGQPVCERLVFKKPSSLSIEAKAAQAEYSSRKKISLHLSTRDGYSAPVQADLSLSVFLIDSLDQIGPPDILSYLWLSSDLKGPVESPEYYFTHEGSEADEAADNLMLTQGWRRFVWQDLEQADNSRPEFLPEHEGHIVLGRITNRKTGKPASQVMVYLSVPGLSYHLAPVLSDAAGLLQFDVPNFYGSEMVVQTDSKTDSIYHFDILNPFSEKYTSILPAPLKVTESMEQAMLSRHIDVQVASVYYGATNLSLAMPGKADTSAFYGTPNARYFLDDYTRFPTMEEVLREYVQYITVRKRQKKFELRVLDLVHSYFFDYDPLLLLDGVPFFDANKIIDFDPLKVKKIEVLNREYFLGPLVAGGIISFSTYKGDLNGFPLDSSALVLEYEGLQRQRQFFSPVYKTEYDVARRLPDFRNVLYWAPQVQTDSSGEREISFYSSDRHGKYLILVQGITDQGLAGVQRSLIEVGQ